MNHFDDEVEVYEELISKNGHAAFVGGTGHGKTVAMIGAVNKAIEKTKSFLVFDPRKEFLYSTSGKAKETGYDVVVIDYSDISKSKTFNPLTYVKDIDKFEHDEAIEELNTIMDQLVPPSKDDKESYWRSSGNDLGLGSLIALLEGAPQYFSLPSAYAFASAAKSKLQLRQFLSQLEKGSVARLLLEGFAAAPADTSGCIVSSFTDNVAFCVKGNAILKAFVRDDFHISDIKDAEKPIAIYLCIPETSNEKYLKICSIFCNQLIHHLFKLAAENRGALNREFDFFLDEFPALSEALPEFPKYISFCRSRNIFFKFVCQTLSQLETVFSKKEMQTIFDNTNSVVYFAINDVEELRKISDKIGERKINFGSYMENRPLLSPNEIAALPIGQAVVFVNGGNKKAVIKFPYDASQNTAYPPINPEKIDLDDEVEIFDFENFFESQKKRTKSKNRRQNSIKNELIRELLGDEDEITPGRILFENQSLFDRKFIVNVLEIDTENKELIKQLADQTNLHVNFLVALLKTKKNYSF